MRNEELKPLQKTRLLKTGLCLCYLMTMHGSKSQFSHPFNGLKETESEVSQPLKPFES